MKQSEPTTGERIILEAARLAEMSEKRAKGAGLKPVSGSVTILLHATALKAAHAAGRMPQADFEKGVAETMELLAGAMREYRAQFLQHDTLAAAVMNYKAH